MESHFLMDTQVNRRTAPREANGGGRQPVELALLGAGNRGRGIFGAYALAKPDQCRFVAVAETDPIKRRAFAEAHGIPPERQFASDTELLAQPMLCQGLIVATLEDRRVEPILRGLELGYAVLSEKPLGCTFEDALRICDAANRYDGIFIVCHQMRYQQGFATIKHMLDSGEYGDIITVQHSENLSYHHMAHSFVRGFFGNDRLTPMILAKSCHDMDILRHLVGVAPRRISSFGSLSHFRPENAPQGAPDYCLDGCPAEAQCPYHVSKIYLTDETDPAYLRQMGVVDDRSLVAEMLRTHPFGRCVYHCDNNVVDHQVVQIEFEGGVTASFTMAGHNYHERRICKISCTNGEIIYDGSERVVRAWTFSPQREMVVRPLDIKGTHGGSDRIIMDAFVRAIRQGSNEGLLTSARTALESHLMAHAAEAARREHTVVDLKAFEQAAREQLEATDADDRGAYAADVAAT